MVPELTHLGAGLIKHTKRTGNTYAYACCTTTLPQVRLTKGGAPRVFRVLLHPGLGCCVGFGCTHDVETGDAGQVTLFCFLLLSIVVPPCRVAFVSIFSPVLRFLLSFPLFMLAFNKCYICLDIVRRAPDNNVMIGGDFGRSRLMGSSIWDPLKKRGETVCLSQLPGAREQGCFLLFEGPLRG